MIDIIELRFDNSKNSQTDLFILCRLFDDKTPTYVLEVREECAKYFGTSTLHNLKLYRTKTLYVNSKNWAITEADLFH